MKEKEKSELLLLSPQLLLLSLVVIKHADQIVQIKSVV